MLPQNQILDIFPGKDGLILSTFNGVVKFNGTEYINLIKDSESKRITFTKIFLDEEKGALYGWEASRYFYRIQPNFKAYNRYATLTNHQDTIIAISKEGKISTFQQGSENEYRTLKTLIKDARIIDYFKGGYYISNEDNSFITENETGVTRVNPYGHVTLFKRNPFKDEAIFLTRENKLFSIDNKGVEFKFDFNADSLVKQIKYLDIGFLGANEYLISSSEGLIYVKNDEVQFYSKEINPLFGDFSYFYPDPNSDVIISGTVNKGIVFLKPKRINVYYVDKVRGSQSFASVVEDNEGHVISSVGYGDFIYIKNDSICKMKHITGNTVASLAWIDDSLFVGTWESLAFAYPSDTNERKVMNFKAINFSLFQKSFYKDRRGTLWVGTGKGIIKREKNNFVPIPSIQDDIIVIYELKNGNLCFGGGKGFYILDKNDSLVFSVDLVKIAPNAKQIRTIYEDDYQNIWIGTYGGGLLVVRNDNVASVNAFPGCMLPNDVFTLAPYRGKLYISSNNGLWSIPEKKLRDFLSHKTDYLIPKHYLSSWPFYNFEFNGGFQNNFLIKDDKIFFPSINGLIEFTPDEEEDVSANILLPVITNIYLNDTLSNGLHEFKRSTHTIRFEYQVVNFDEERNVYYQNKLIVNGKSKGWSAPQKNGEVVFNMLPPGKYEFLVRCLNSANENTPVVVTYKFEIKPFFYETIGFIIAGSLLLLGVIVLIVIAISKRTIEKSNTKNTILELQLNNLQSRLNPHFLFNSLNNVVYLLTEKKYTDAEKFLTDFSLLLRKYAEKTDTVISPLSVEIEILDLYLSIQQKRFNYKFDYSIECPPELLELPVPSFVMQLYAENSIYHGFVRKGIKGKLKIQINKVKNTLYIIIEDNGVGLSKSKEINNWKKTS